MTTDLAKRSFESRVRNLFSNHFGDEFPKLEEVKNAYEFLRERYMALQTQENQQALRNLGRGDIVVLKQENGNHRLPGGTVGTVERLGIKNISVDFGPYRKWRVPAGWVELAPKGTEAPNRPSLPPRRRRPVYQETPPDRA